MNNYSQSPQAQGVFVDIQAQVEDIAPIEVARDSKGSVPKEQNADTTDKGVTK